MTRSIKYGLLVVLLGLIFFTVSCDVSKETVEPTIDRVGEPIIVTVYFYPNTSQVTAKYREIHNVPRRAEIPDRKGFAMWPEWRNAEGEPIDPPDGAVIDCQIHTVQPKKVDDDATLTLGHELLHCLYGSYHKQ